MDLSYSLLIFAASAAFTPGPNNMMIMASGLNYGVRASLPHFFGICLGFPAMFFAMGFGLGRIFEASVLLHECIQVLGLAYLLYLACLIAMADSNGVEDDLGEETKSRPLTFVQAALFQWINPKAWIMGGSAITAFSTVGAEMQSQVLMIGLIFLIMAFPSAAVWMLFGAGLKQVMRNPLYFRVFNATMAILLVASMAPIAITLFDKYIGR